ncbi:unnamed protein product [[Candida] boidinii]|nr:unnamed protein product [[Candida] boidinii]
MESVIVPVAASGSDFISVLFVESSASVPFVATSIASLSSGVFVISVPSSLVSSSSSSSSLSSSSDASDDLIGFSEDAASLGAVIGSGIETLSATLSDFSCSTSG